MKNVALIIAVLALLWIAIEDFRTRKFSIFSLVILLVVALVSIDYSMLGFYLVGMLSICVLFISSVLIHALKTGGSLKKVKSAIGAGDILLPLIIALYFPPVELLFIVLSATIVSLVYALISKVKLIPYAGMFAICCSLVICLEVCCGLMLNPYV